MNERAMRAFEAGLAAAGLPTAREFAELALLEERMPGLRRLLDMGSEAARDLDAFNDAQARQRAAQQAGNVERRDRATKARAVLEDAARRNRAGEKWLAIAADLGISEDALRARVRRAGLKGRGRPASENPVTRMRDRIRR